MRDVIYELTAHDEQSFRLKLIEKDASDSSLQHHLAPITEPHASHLLCSESGLILTSHKVKKEYLDMVRQVALGSSATGSVTAQVRDFDFGQLFKTLLDLPPADFAAIKSGRKLRVQLAITSFTKISEAIIDSWAQLCKQHGLTASYEVDDYDSRGAFIVDQIVNVRLVSAAPGTETDVVRVALLEWARRRRQLECYVKHLAPAQRATAKGVAML